MCQALPAHHAGRFSSLMPILHSTLARPQRRLLIALSLERCTKNNVRRTWQRVRHHRHQVLPVLRPPRLLRTIAASMCQALSLYSHVFCMMVPVSDSIASCRLRRARCSLQPFESLASENTACDMICDCGSGSGSSGRSSSSTSGSSSSSSGVASISLCQLLRV